MVNPWAVDLSPSSACGDRVFAPDNSTPTYFAPVLDPYRPADMITNAHPLPPILTVTDGPNVARFVNDVDEVVSSVKR